MMDQKKPLDQDKSAAILRGALAVKRMNQGSLARKIGLSRSLVSMFLARKINLKEPDILRCLEVLDLKKDNILLSITANIGG